MTPLLLSLLIAASPCDGDAPLTPCEAALALRAEEHYRDGLVCSARLSACQARLRVRTATAAALLASPPAQPPEPVESLWPLALTSGAVGLALGLGGSYVFPWGFAKAPPAEAPALQPKVGEVLTAGGQSALVISGSVFELPAGDRVAAVLWVRGREGKTPVKVTGCTAGRGSIVMLDRPDEPERWRPGDKGMHAQVAQAVCNATPQTAA